MFNIEDYVVPVVCVGARNGRLYVSRILGTAFTVNSRGDFLTARHVVENAVAHAKETGERASLMLREHDGQRFGVPIHQYSFADAPYDVAAGRLGATERKIYSCFEKVALDAKLWTWEEVWTVGYPEALYQFQLGAIMIDTRGLHGYITRPIRTNLNRDPIRAFELNFPFYPGMSGSPLFLRNQPKSEGLVVFGICVGSQRSEVQEDSYEEAREDQTITKEVFRVEHFAVAHDLRALADWKPGAWDGRRLWDNISPTFRPDR